MITLDSGCGRNCGNSGVAAEVMSAHEEAGVGVRKERSSATLGEPASTNAANRNSRNPLLIIVPPGLFSPLYNLVPAEAHSETSIKNKKAADGRKTAAA
jgi:hypothetical protein